MAPERSMDTEMQMTIMRLQKQLEISEQKNRELQRKNDKLEEDKSRHLQIIKKAAISIRTTYLRENEWYVRTIEEENEKLRAENNELKKQKETEMPLKVNADINDFNRKIKDLENLNQKLQNDTKMMKCRLDNINFENRFMSKQYNVNLNQVEELKKKLKVKDELLERTAHELEQKNKQIKKEAAHLTELKEAVKTLEEKERRLRKAAEESEKKKASKGDTVQTQGQQAANKNSGSGQSKRTISKEAEKEGPKGNGLYTDNSKLYEAELISSKYYYSYNYYPHLLLSHY